MGRPLFSVNYPQSRPAVHVDPELPDEHPPVCERWSYSKPFDPDSEEFFLDEIYEAPVDTAALENRDPAPLSPIDDASSSESGSSADEADRVDREAMIAIAREVIDADDAGVVRRVNQASEQRLRAEAANENQPSGGPRTIIPISVNTTPGRPQPVVIPSPQTPQTPTFTAPSTPPSASIMATPGTSFPFRASPQDATPRLYTWERDDYDPYWAIRAPINSLPSPTPNRRSVSSHWQVTARGVRSVAF